MKNKHYLTTLIMASKKKKTYSPDLKATQRRTRHGMMQEQTMLD